MGVHRNNQPAKTQVRLPEPENPQSSSRTSDDGKCLYSRKDSRPVWSFTNRCRTHWEPLLQKCPSLVPTELDVMAFDPQLYVRLSNVEGSCPAQFPPVNLPLCGNAFDETTLSYAEIMSYIPSRAASSILIQRYLETVEGTHRLFHLPTLYQELADFWSDQTSAEYDWLGQLFMILALGYRASVNEMQFSLSGPTTASPSRMDKFIFAAQICLKKSGYMLTAKNTIIRALSLMAIAIQTSGYSCHNFDACGPWLDTAMRHCMRLGHHKSASRNSNTSPFDAYVARRIWTTVVYLKLQQSMNSGTPLLLRSSDFEDAHLADIDDEDMHIGSCHCTGPVSRMSPTSTTWTEGTYQVLLAKSLHTAVDIVSRANSPVDNSDEMSYECVMRYDAFFRELLRATGSMYSNTAPTGNFRDSWRTYQCLTIETFFRRILLILHQPFGQRPQTQNLVVATNEAFTPQSVSHWSLLECSLAVLVAQRQMLEDAPADGPLSTTRRLYEELLKQDFFIAALFAGIQIDSEYQFQHQYQPRKVGTDGCVPKASFLRELESDAESLQNPQLLTFTGPQIPPRQTITQTLRCCQSIWARSLHGESGGKCSIWVYLILGKMIDMLNTAPGCLVGES